MDAELKAAALRAEGAALRFRLAGHRLLLALRANPFWYLQPRWPAGRPDGGRWRPSGQVAPQAGLPLLAFIARIAPGAYRAFRAVAQRIAPLLRRLPEGWLGEEPEESAFDDPTRRIGPPTPRRPEHEHVRFRTAAELRTHLGPAGPGRQWHHIVEARLAGRRFRPEQVHSTDNVVNVPIEVHHRVSAKMSSKQRYTEGKRLRDWLEPRSFEEQYQFGVDLLTETMEEMGYDPDTGLKR
jgi:hypothetical protein